MAFQVDRNRQIRPAVVFTKNFVSVLKIIFSELDVVKQNEFIDLPHLVKESLPWHELRLMDSDSLQLFSQSP